MAQTVTTTTRQWRELVEKHDDKNRQRDSLYPIAYEFNGGEITFRDPGPTKGIYTPGS